MKSILIRALKKKDLLKKILRLHRLVEKYANLKKNNSNDKITQEKINEKLPKFVLALQNLNAQKRNLNFEDNFNIDTKKFLDFDKTNDNTKFLSEKNVELAHRLSLQDNSHNFSENFQKSFKSIFDSLKTDHFSHHDRTIIKELKQISISSNKNIFEQKLKEIEHFIKIIK
jgi:hypothetical protein